MTREDALLALKEAEDQRHRLIEDAWMKSEENLVKAKRDAALKLEQGKAKAAEMREALLEARVQKIEDEARLVMERGKNKARRLKDIAQDNVEEAVSKLIAAFERELDV